MDTPKKEAGGGAERRDEASTVNLLRQQYDVQPGTKMDAILGKIARGEDLTEDERDAIDDLQNAGKKTKKVGHLPSKGHVLTSDVTEKINEIRATLPSKKPVSFTPSAGSETKNADTSAPAADIPEFVKPKPAELNKPFVPFWQRLFGKK